MSFKNQAVVECITHKLISKFLCYKNGLLCFQLSIYPRMSHKTCTIQPICISQYFNISIQIEHSITILYNQPLYQYIAILIYHNILMTKATREKSFTVFVDF